MHLDVFFSSGNVITILLRSSSLIIFPLMNLASTEAVLILTLFVIDGIMQLNLENVLIVSRKETMGFIDACSTN